MPSSGAAARAGGECGDQGDAGYSKPEPELQKGQNGSDGETGRVLNVYLSACYLVFSITQHRELLMALLRSD